MSPRRDKGDGSLFFREDEQRWVGRVKGADGKMHTISVSVGALSKSEAKKKAKLKLEEAKKVSEQESIPASQTLEKYLEIWLEGKRKLKRGTKATWKWQIALYILPYLGSYTLLPPTSPDEKQLDRERVNAWITELCESGDLAASSIRTFYGILELALKEAVEQEIIERSPCFKISLPRVEEKEMSVLDADQTKAFLAHLAKEEHAHEAFFRILIYTGLRSGEGRALKWTDIDLDKREMKVQRSLTYIKRQGFFENEPKTRNSRRTIILADEVVEALREHHKKQLLHITSRYRKTVGWEDKGLVFPGPSGNYMHECTPEQSLNRVLERAGLPHLRVHDLRHTYATLALLSGIDINSVSSTLGHSDILITLRRYIHILPRSKQENIQKLSRLLA